MGIGNGPAMETNADSSEIGEGNQKDDDVLAIRCLERRVLEILGMKEGTPEVDSEGRELYRPAFETRYGAVRNDRHNLTNFRDGGRIDRSRGPLSSKSAVNEYSPCYVCGLPRSQREQYRASRMMRTTDGLPLNFDLFGGI